MCHPEFDRAEECISSDAVAVATARWLQNAPTCNAYDTGIILYVVAVRNDGEGAS